MITLAILEQLAADNGDFVIDENLFWEEAPLQHDGNPAEGTWIVTRGGSATNTPKGHNLRTTVDFYVAYADKVETEAALAGIAEWLRSNRYICLMRGPHDDNVEVIGGDFSYSFRNVRILPTTTPVNNGTTENGNIVKIESADIIYDLDDVIS